MRARPGLAVLMLSTVVGAGPALTPSAAARVKRHVMPDKHELAWRKVEWRPTLWDAVIDAHKEKKPILLWAMNGHALACT